MQMYSSLGGRIPHTDNNIPLFYYLSYRYIDAIRLQVCINRIESFITNFMADNNIMTKC